MFYKGLRGNANIPIQDLERPLPKTKHHHPEHYKHMYNRTDTFKFSFIPSVIKDWNSLDYSTITNAELTTNSPQNFAGAVRKNHAGC